MASFSRKLEAEVFAGITGNGTPQEVAEGGRAIACIAEWAMCRGAPEEDVWMVLRLLQDLHYEDSLKSIPVTSRAGPSGRMRRVVQNKPDAFQLISGGLTRGYPYVE